MDFGVGYRLPGGYTVEWFWGDFYMWGRFDFGCFRDFWDLGWFWDLGNDAGIGLLELDFLIRCWSWIFRVNS